MSADIDELIAVAESAIGPAEFTFTRTSGPTAHWRCAIHRSRDAVREFKSEHFLALVEGAYDDSRTQAEALRRTLQVILAWAERRLVYNVDGLPSYTRNAS